MTEDVFGWDAAFCPDPPPRQTNLARFSYGAMYLGGSSAFHVWNVAERQLLAASGLPVVPIWVPTPGSDNPRQVGMQAAAALADEDIPPYATPWRVLMWDLETGVEPDPPWLEIAANTLEAHGYGSLVYGSELGSGLFSYAPRSGYVLAHYDGLAQLPPRADVIAKQYAANQVVPGGRVDLNVARPQLLSHIGPLT